MPRLFVALPLPDDITDALGGLRGGVPDARWVPDENLHITLCFCGEVDGATMHDLVDDLATVGGMPFEVSIAGVDLFADGKRPRALVAKVEKSPSLEQLRMRVVNVARGCGIAVDRRRFRPHVTLARFGAWAEAGHHLAQFVAGNNLVRAGPWLSESFLLYRSRMAPDGAVYTVEAEYPLGW
jgi:2'-5' RNA ligase